MARPDKYSIKFKGIMQAEQIAGRLKNFSIDFLYSSDLQRAYETADKISQSIDLPITKEPRLQERNMGVFQGLTREEIANKYPDDYAKFLSGDLDHAMEGGESLRAFDQRCMDAYESIAKKTPRKTCCNCNARWVFIRTISKYTAYTKQYEQAFQCYQLRSQFIYLRKQYI